MGLPSWLGGGKKTTTPPPVAPLLAPPAIPSLRPATDAGFAATNAARRQRSIAESASSSKPTVWGKMTAGLGQGLGRVAAPADPVSKKRLFARTLGPF